MFGLSPFSIFLIAGSIYLSVEHQFFSSGIRGPGLCPYVMEHSDDFDAAASFLIPNATTGTSTTVEVEASLCAFSESYLEARDKFRHSAKAAGAELHALQVLGEDYTIDIALLKGKGEGLVVHSSGVNRSKHTQNNTLETCTNTIITFLSFRN